MLQKDTDVDVDDIDVDDEEVEELKE